MGTLTFNVIKTPENQLGIAILDGNTEAGMLTVSLDCGKEAIAYISDGTIYVYTADNNGRFKPSEQIDTFLAYERNRGRIEFQLIARGLVKIEWRLNCMHLSIGTTLVASIYFDDTKSLLIIDRLVKKRPSPLGLDLYDPDVLRLIEERGTTGINTLVLALHDLIYRTEITQQLYSGKLH